MAQMLCSAPETAGEWNGMLPQDVALCNIDRAKYRHEKEHLLQVTGWERHFYDKDTMPVSNFREEWERRLRARLEQLNSQGKDTAVTLHAIKGGPECDREVHRVLAPLVQADNYPNLRIGLYLWKNLVIYKFPDGSEIRADDAQRMRAARVRWPAGTHITYLFQLVPMAHAGYPSFPQHTKVTASPGFQAL